jgi:hypothetical protein
LNEFLEHAVVISMGGTHIQLAPFLDSYF